MSPKFHNLYNPRKETPACKFPPSSVTQLGFISLGDRIGAILRNGKFIPPMSDAVEYDDDAKESDLWEDAPDVSFDETNSIEFDKLDAIEKKSEIISSMEKTGANFREKFKSKSKSKIDSVSSALSSNETSSVGVGETNSNATGSGV